MTKHKKLLPINSKVSFSQLSGNQYHTIKTYYKYAVVDGNWSILEIAEEKHKLGECKHCKELIEFLDKQTQETQ